METKDENKKKELDPQFDIDRDEDIDWDNGEATYGHKRTEFKRKDQPDEAHLANTEGHSEHDVNKTLKNTNLSKDEDIANRNKEADKGISGKDQ
ncbi:MULTISPECIES: hypothetical protein [Pedobacter]|uniref:Uncharacterized protein n=1 Tax=Pedobacter zeae TaxID=1737356 RepID=A0A7W6KGH8_9SPHI|nr:hypothetical protein [Pedobacter zeae]MBB4110270.1 hypothetical protein [Pedobacter zeae]GGH17028.1 hypothetical protein GCM10007422_40130 [Pedobacter zeae]